MYEYETYELYACEVGGTIDSQAHEGWRLVSCFPTGKPVYYEEYGCRVMLVFERKIND